MQQQSSFGRHPHPDLARLNPELGLALLHQTGVAADVRWCKVGEDVLATSWTCPPPPDRGGRRYEVAGEERTLALNSRRGQGTTSCNFPSLLPFAMKRKQKRFLQMTLLFMVALIFLPNVGLWSLYKEKHLVKSAEPGEQQGVNAELGPGVKVGRIATRLREDPHASSSLIVLSRQPGRILTDSTAPLCWDTRDSVP
ncbi:hypothetical protein CB1_000548005 [Camelus ferus]|nr:hypothetical protein CB1_000548005 [Camelus ferus]